MRSIESKHGLTYIMGREIQFVDSLKEFGTLYKSKLDENQLYINGVNCFMYIPEQMNTACTLELNVPKDYRVATGLKAQSKHQFKAKDFHELVDCPLIASNSLKHHTFEESKVLFHLWFQGECKPDFKKLENDFKKF